MYCTADSPFLPLLNPPPTLPFQVSFLQDPSKLTSVCLPLPTSPFPIPRWLLAA